MRELASTIAVFGCAVVLGGCANHAPSASARAEQARHSQRTQCDGTSATIRQQDEAYAVFPNGASAHLSASLPVVWAKEGPCADQIGYTVDSQAVSKGRHAQLNLGPGHHRLTVTIPTCAGSGPRCRGGLHDVTSHISVR